MKIRENFIMLYSMEFDLCIYDRNIAEVSYG